MAITAAYHVPRNDALMSVDAAGTDATAAWRDYAGPWVRLNHVRAAAAPRRGERDAGSETS